MGKLDELSRSAGSLVRASTAATSGLPQPGAFRGGTPERYAGLLKDKEAQQIPVEKIVPDPDQPRKEFDPEKMDQLAASFRRFGQLQPIIVRWIEPIEHYMVVAGERRLRAAILAGKAMVRAIVFERKLTPEEVFDLQMAENLHRDDHKPVELGRAYKRMMEGRGWSLRQVAEHLEIGHTSVKRAIDLVDLPPSVQAAVDEGRIGPTVAAELAALGDPAVQEEVARAVVDEDLRRGEVQDLVKSIRAKRPAPAPRPEPWTVEVEPGVTVSIRWKKSGGCSAAQALRKATQLLKETGRESA